MREIVIKGVYILIGANIGALLMALVIGGARGE